MTHSWVGKAFGAPVPKYCKRCGAGLVKLLADGWDSQSGERNTRLACFNVTGCADACSDNGGHQLSFWSNKCKRCSNHILEY